MVEPSPPGEPVRLQQPQAVLTPLTASAIFLVVTIEPGGEDVVRDLLADVAGLERTVGFRAPDAGLALVTGIGSDAWDRLFAGPRPAELHPFVELHGRTAPRAVDAGRPALPHPGGASSTCASSWRR